MKKAIVILLTLLVFLQPFSKMWIYVSFKINQDTIAKTLCVKKEIENNTFQGKCYFKKQLEKADKEKQKQLSQTLKEKIPFAFGNMEYLVCSAFT